MLVFRLSFVNYCPSNLLSGSSPPPLPPSQSQGTVYTDSVWLAGGAGVLSCAGEHNLQEFKTLVLTRFRTYKIALPPPNNNLGGERPQKNKHLPQSPFTGQSF